MTWHVAYSKRADSFIKEQGIQTTVRELVRDFILKITGAPGNVDVRKLKGDWAGYYRIRKGKIRIIIKPDSGSATVFVDAVDFRGSVYRR
jgi:mRNA interferase RelE/StbE